MELIKKTFGYGNNDSAAWHDMTYDSSSLRNWVKKSHLGDPTNP